MTVSDSFSPLRDTGYRLDQLAAAFDRVRDPRDWKAPILAVIPVEERPLVEKAVRWFTETTPEFDPAPGATDRLVVRAAGYRLGPSGVPERARTVDGDGESAVTAIGPMTGQPARLGVRQPVPGHRGFHDPQYSQRR